mgnify:FL=1
MWNETLRGQTGIQIEEINVRNEIQSEYLLQLPRAGENLTLSIDVRLQEKLYTAIETLA